MPTDEIAKPDQPDNIGALVSGGAGLAAFFLGNPEAAFLAPWAAPYITFSSRVLRDKARRTIRMHRAAVARSGIGREEFTARAASSERARFLTDAAIRAAQGTYWPESARAIGRALAEGVLDSESTSVDVPAAVLAMMAELTESHVRVLDLITTRRFRQSPREPYETTAEPVDAEHYQQLQAVRWTAKQVTAIMPETIDLLPGLLSRLDALGLVAQLDQTAKVIAGYSRSTTKEANRINPSRIGQAAGPYKAPSAITEPEAQRLLASPSWSATALGRQLLGYYELAGNVPEQC